MWWSVLWSSNHPLNLGSFDVELETPRLVWAALIELIGIKYCLNEINFIPVSFGLLKTFV